MKEKVLDPEAVLLRLIAPILLLLVLPLASPAAMAEPRHGIAMHGEPKMPADFEHFPYVNPQAPKGGELRLGVQGTYDSMNPLIVRGVPAAGVRDYVFESLLARGLDEPFTLYGLIAHAIEVPADRSAITFHLNPAARFSDGAPLTAADVAFSFEVLRDKGRPNHRAYFKKVERVETLGPHLVRFIFKPAEPEPGQPPRSSPSYDREMPLIVGLMPVVPAHVYTHATFERTSLEAPIGSGPYRVGRIEPGRSLTYTRDPGYWGKDLPVNRGRFNFDEITFDYYRDSATLLEAFRAGTIDFRTEEDPARWAESYSIPALADGRILKKEFATGLPAGMTGLAFNTRRSVFKDAKVRQALIAMFDFAWINRNLYHGLFKRTQSYFERSILSTSGRPASEEERRLLAPFIDRIKPEILAGTYRFPTTDGTGRNRANWQLGQSLLEEAGYRLVKGRPVDRLGRQLGFEILAGSTVQERLLISFAGDLQKLGIAARVRVVDSTQYQARLRTFDYDMIQTSWPSSLSPGNEQLFRWAAAAAVAEGSYNYAGVADPAVDAMIEAMLSALNPDGFVAAVRALDRVLLSGDYVIPLFHLPAQWVAHWRHLKHPDTTPLFGYTLDAWWTGKSTD